MKFLRIVALVLAVTFIVSPHICAAQAVAPPQQPVSGTSSVEGLVTRSGSGAPIAGIKVTLIYIPPPAPRPPMEGGGVGMIADRFSVSALPPTIASSAPASAPSLGTAPPASSIPSVLTDNKGSFAFHNLVAGNYRLTVAGNGYVSQEYGRTSSVTFANANSGSITLGSGQNLTGISFKLVPTGNISGRVQDFSGQPQAGVPVTLYRSGFSPTGDRNATTIATARTNDRGEYRIFWIAPGHYYLLAGGNSAVGRPANSINNDVPDVFVYAFYPQGSDIDEASSIEVRPGSELSGYNFKLGPQATYSISGRVVDSRTGQPPVNGNVSINGRSPMGARSSSGRSFYDPATGVFTITELPPGTYNLTSILNERTVGAPNTTGAFAASSVVRIVSADVRDVTLTIAQGQSVSGQIKADVPLPSGLRMQVRLMLAPNSAPGTQGAGAQVNPDGSFTFDSGAFRSGPGVYFVTLNNVIGNSGLSAGWYLKEVKLGETDVTNSAVRLPSSELLTLVLGSKGGQIRGSVRNEQTQLLPRMYAVLVPENLNGRIDRIQQVLSDQNGRFNFANVGPGNYKLYAWEDVESGLWLDPEWLRDWEEKGTAVRIEEGSQVDIELKTIPQGGLQ